MSYREAKAEKRRSPKRLVKLEITKGKNGGHVVTHHHERKGQDGYPMHEQPEEHVFGAGQGGEMMAHVAQHMGVQQEAPGDAEDGGDEAADEE
jgi:hypothetical protein